MATADNGPVRFLLAEDDPDHAELVMRAMRKNNIANEIMHVSDGAQAIAYLRKQPPFEDAKRPDIVILDLNMPKKNGHEVIEDIKSDPQLSSIPIVVLTTSKSEADRARAYQGHANSFLVKPLDFDQFQEMIKQLGLYWMVFNEPPPG